jgi:hypothetical protein
LRNARSHFEPLRTLRASRVETRPDSFTIAASSGVLYADAACATSSDFTFVRFKEIGRLIPVIRPNPENRFEGTWQTTNRTSAGGSAKLKMTGAGGADGRRLRLPIFSDDGQI